MSGLCTPKCPTTVEKCAQSGHRAGIAYRIGPKLLDFIALYGIGLSLILGMMTGLWFLSLKLRDSSIVDIFWGTGFEIAALVYALLVGNLSTRGAIALLLVIVWGVRLTVHIGWRNIGSGEDKRYARWRSQHGARYWIASYFRVFLLQGVVMWIVSAPLLQALYHDAPDRLAGFDVLGIVVWLAGFGFEAVGDWQLARFKADPANSGKVIDSGLWRYTRHPNYFGEATLWWGFFLLAVSTPGGLLTIISPILMTYLLVRVSGAALLEGSLREEKPEYVDYIRRTSAFIPMPPKH
jgi:steroid 5-alpha reductase family enzyme